MRQSTILILIFMSSFLFSCRQKTEQESKLYRFYDFNISIDVINYQSMQSTRYLLCNLGRFYDKDNNQEYSLKKNILYKIDYKYHLNPIDSTKVNRFPIDTTEIQLNMREIDEMFSLTHAFFQLENSTNISTDSIPKPPPFYDGPHANISLDLGYRGDRFITEIGLPGRNKNYIEIMKYLNNIIKKPVANSKIPASRVSVLR